MHAYCILIRYFPVKHAINCIIWVEKKKHLKTFMVHKPQTIDIPIHMHGKKCLYVQCTTHELNVYPCEFCLNVEKR